MSKLMVSVSGVRGIFGESLTPEIALKYAAHFGIFSERGKIIVGRDSRVTGQAMFNAVTAGLMSVGCDVVDLGIVSTPTVLLAVEESDASGGISITASHNPAEWNAMKFVGANGMFLFPENADTFINSLDKPVDYVGWDRIGKLSSDPDGSKRHIEKILQIPYLDVEKIKAKKFKVVLDCVNGAGGMIAPDLLRALGCEVIELNCEPTGIFAHIPEPLNKNLGDLEKAVAEHKADLGFATDPDVDRLSVVDETGKCIGEEFSLLLAEKFILSKVKGDIVINLSSSMASEDVAAEFGVQVHRTKVGEINVGKKMKELQSPVGGEGNGGIICPEVHYTRDAPAGMAIILGYLAERNEPISKLAAEIPHYYFAKNKIKVDPAELDNIMAKVPEIFADYTLDTTDGIKVLGEKFWIHIRKSGTEPIIRVYVESETAEKSEQICKETIEKLM
ncbi:MAG: phosphoglucosamine mutase [Candidatus Cloacimonetes bacterium]|nr:phosphoglucosamine mutase [Candidatus Cloacimonadota bacterium]MCF7813924.1 phosphoglucosamine mutase [Candidatus Cloacimonadota bacterium]MCF7868521.1 phosphoglucosamine mutase [Candidatus Cloacimonadota bacterium]MCF7884036.1 phosphoglucosamine mutase [Candidatus Cloacimonadota bacterium]